MPQSFILQDWTHLEAASGVAEIVQNSSGWLDLSGFTDVVFHLSVTEFSGNELKLYYETSPSMDEDLFRYMDTESISTVTTTPTVTKVLFSSATTPLARYVRWRLAPISGAFHLSFRVYVSANATG